MPANIIATVVALIVALATALGLGFGLSSETTGSSRPAQTDVPASATQASAAQLEDFFSSTWRPAPAYRDNTISFERETFGGQDGYFVNAPGTCNGVGAFIPAAQPDPSTLRIQATPLTKMACDGLDYEARLNSAFTDGVQLLIDGSATAYLISPTTTLTLNRV